MKINSSNIQSVVTHANGTHCNPLWEGQSSSHCQSSNGKSETGCDASRKARKGARQVNGQVSINPIDRGYVRTYKYKTAEVVDHHTGSKLCLENFFTDPEQLEELTYSVAPPSNNRGAATTRSFPGEIQFCWFHSYSSPPSKSSLINLTRHAKSWTFREKSWEGLMLRVFYGLTPTTPPPLVHQNHQENVG